MTTRTHFRVPTHARGPCKPRVFNVSFISASWYIWLLTKPSVPKVTIF